MKGFAFAAPFSFTGSMAAYTSSQNGLWSDQATWGASGPPGSGDTATVNHTVTVASNTTVGNSPNNTTSMVLSIGVGGQLVVSSGVTLTIKGNAEDFFSTLTLNSGAIVFDNSGSGGSPVYKWAGVFSGYAFNGTSGTHCSMSAIAGQTFTFTQSNSLASIIGTYADFTRMAASTWSFHTTSCTEVTLTNCTFTSCGLLMLSWSSTSGNLNVSNNTFTSGTDATLDFHLTMNGTHSSGTRSFVGNILNLTLTYQSLGVTATGNYFGDAIQVVPGSTFAVFTPNFIRQLTQCGANGNRFEKSIGENYLYYINEVGNPHFCSGQADAQNVVLDGLIFEFDGPLGGVDTGDCIFSLSSGGFKVTVQNCIVLKSSRSGNAYGSGSFVHYNTSATTTAEYLHNTIFGRLVFSDLTKLGAINVGEAGAGHANEVPLIKSNIVWSDVADTATIAARLTGTTNGIITAAGVDYNNLFNGTAGNNGRGYDDRSANLDLWTGGAADGGNAAANNVDNNQLQVDPQFVDSARNLAKWDLSLGGAGTSAAGITRIKADPTTNIPLLIAYVKAGFAPTNVALRNNGHDGVTRGAVEGVFPGSARHLFSVTGNILGGLIR